jgi:hypothetical protein
VPSQVVGSFYKPQQRIAQPFNATLSEDPALNDESAHVERFQFAQGARSVVEDAIGEFLPAVETLPDLLVLRLPLFPSRDLRLVLFTFKLAFAFQFPFSAAIAYLDNTLSPSDQNGHDDTERTGDCTYGERQPRHGATAVRKGGRRLHSRSM